MMLLMNSRTLYSMKKLNSTCLGQRKNKKQGAMFSHIVVGEGFSD